MEFTTIEDARERLSLWREQAKVAPQRGPGSAVRRRVRDLEILLSIAAKRAHEAQRAASDLQGWLDTQAAEPEEAEHCAES